MCLSPVNECCNKAKREKVRKGNEGDEGIKGRKLKGYQQRMRGCISGKNRKQGKEKARKKRKRKIMIILTFYKYDKT